MFSLIVAGQTARLKTAAILSEFNLQSGDDAILLAIQSHPNLNEFELAEMTGQLVRDLFPRLERLLHEDLVVRDPNAVLTAKGKVVAKIILDHWASLDADFSNKIHPKKRKKLRQLFRDFAGL